MQYLTIKGMEELLGQSQECISKLKAAWFFAALVLLLKYVLLWIPLVNILGVILARVADILFVVMAFMDFLFYRTHVTIVIQMEMRFMAKEAALQVRMNVELKE